MIRVPPLLCLAAALICAAPAAGWFLEGLVASWVVPDVDGRSRDGNSKRTDPTERTQPLQLPEEPDEPTGFAPLHPHPSTTPPMRRARRTSRGDGSGATPTVKDIEMTAQLYQLLKDRSRPAGNSLSVSGAASWRRRRPACMQRFICEVHMQQDNELARAGDIEKNIVNTLKKFHTQSPSSEVYQYTYAAHMGRLMRDSPPSGCHELFSTCPFSKNDMLLLMASISSSTHVELA